MHATNSGLLAWLLVPTAASPDRMAFWSPPGPTGGCRVSTRPSPTDGGADVPEAFDAEVFEQAVLQAVRTERCSPERLKEISDEWWNNVE